MGEAYLLPAIAAVVLGGAWILGGRGSYFGTVAGVILITLLQSILSVVQMPDSGRQITRGGDRRHALFTDASARRDSAPPRARGGRATHMTGL